MLGNDLGGRLAVVTVRQLTPTDWADLWPMLQGFGTGLTEAVAQEVYLDLLADPRWAIFGYDESRYDENARLVGYAAVQETTGLTCARAVATMADCTTCTYGRSSVGVVSAERWWRRLRSGRLSACDTWSGRHTTNGQRRSTSGWATAASRARSPTIPPSKSTSPPDARAAGSLPPPIRRRSSRC